MTRVSRIASGGKGLPPTRNTKAGIVAAVWAVVGSAIAVVLFPRPLDAGLPIHWTDLFAWSGAWLLWLPAAIYLIRTGRRFPVGQGRSALRIVAYVTGGALAVAAMLAVRVGLNHLFGTTGSFLEHPFLVQAAVYDVLFFSALVAWGHASAYYRRFSERELRSTELEAELGRVQLRFLKMQLHPHFLFNSLQMISSMIHSDPEKADRVLIVLGDLLRKALENSEQQEITLAEELAFIDRYLEISQMRFGGRLRIKREIEAEALEALVPNLVLQPLLENAILHGVAHRTEGGELGIRAWRANGHLRLEVLDNGPGLTVEQEASLGRGIGLTNTHRRILQLYGEDQRLVIRNRPEGGAVASLRIPYRSGAPAAAEISETAVVLTHPTGEKVLDDSGSDRRRRAVHA